MNGTYKDTTQIILTRWLAWSIFFFAHLSIIPSFVHMQLSKSQEILKSTKREYIRLSRIKRIIEAVNSFRAIVHWEEACLYRFVLMYLIQRMPYVNCALGGLIVFQHRCICCSKGTILMWSVSDKRGCENVRAEDVRDSNTPKTTTKGTVHFLKWPESLLMKWSLINGFLKETSYYSRETPTIWTLHSSSSFAGGGIKTCTKPRKQFI